MLATIPDGRDVDLSHLSAQVVYAISPETSQAAKKSQRYLVLGLIVSGAIHALVLLVNWQQEVSAGKQSKSTKITIQLQTLLAPEPLVEQTPVIIPADTELATPETTPVLRQQPSQASSPPLGPGQQPETPKTKRLVLQPLTADELRDITQSNSGSRQSVPADGIATNVFHAGLRQRLQEEERKPELQSVERGPNTHTDPSGATIVDPGGGNCLRSSLSRSGEAQNWYMTSCGGTSESERIMDRVNQEVNERFK